MFECKQGDAKSPWGHLTVSPQAIRVVGNIRKLH